MFNPVALRSPRLLGMVADFGRINKRMHNKSFTADGQVSIVGGRNIGDEYFEANAEMNFADLDVAVIGPVVKEVSDQFDLYWNNQSAVPITALSRQNTTPEQFAAKRAALIAHHEDREGFRLCGEPARQRVCPAAQESKRFLLLGTGHDRERPSRQGGSPPPPRRRRISRRSCARSSIKRNASCFSSRHTSCRGRRASTLLAGVRQRGPRVVVITNSLASTDGVPVHSKYQHYRKPLLQAGVELYEIKPTAGAKRERTTESVLADRPDRAAASLHAKTFAFDRRIGFVGSYNLDPRSSRLNTEMGVLFDCPELAKRLPENTERDLDRNAYRVELVGNRLVWVTREGDKASPLSTPSPRSSLWKRIKVQRAELAADRGAALRCRQNRHVDLMRQLLASIFTLLLAAAIALALLSAAAEGGKWDGRPDLLVELDAFAQRPS